MVGDVKTPHVDQGAKTFWARVKATFAKARGSRSADDFARDGYLEYSQWEAMLNEGIRTKYAGPFRAAFELTLEAIGKAKERGLSAQEFWREWNEKMTYAQVRSSASAYEAEQNAIKARKETFEASRRQKNKRARLEDDAA